MDIREREGTIQIQKSVAIFCCYAHEDQPLLLKLRTHLAPLHRMNAITLWADIDINAGTEWEKEVHQRLGTAQIILLLVSPDFMASDYCYSIEMKQALDRHKRGEAKVIPIILRPVHWHTGPLGKLQALPDDGKPVTDSEWHSLDQAFYNVVDGIHKVVMQLIEATSQLIRTIQADVPNFDKFTEEVARVLIFVEEEAKRFQHTYYGTEHLLLGLIREEEGIAVKILSNISVKKENIRSAVEFIIGRGDFLAGPGLTPRSKKVLELAAHEAKRLHPLNRYYIGTEHLLLSLLREGEGIAAGVLESLGANLWNVRAQIYDVYGITLPPALKDAYDVLEQIQNDRQQAYKKHELESYHELSIRYSEQGHLIDILEADRDRPR